MESLADIINLLYRILKAQGLEKITHIASFQKYIFDDSFPENENFSVVLCDLAYDMDFYEPNEEQRKQSPSFYGDEELGKRIKSTIAKLESIGL